MKTSFKYDKLIQENMDLSDCDSVYDLQDPILNSPIYSSSLFYRDLLQIYQNFVPDPYVDIDAEINTFYNDEMLPAFMKQFGGILPLWSGLTVPEGIERYHNQPAEGQMLIVKDLLIEKQLEIGSGRVKGTRFAELMRDLVEANYR